MLVFLDGFGKESLQVGEHGEVFEPKVELFFHLFSFAFVLVVALVDLSEVLSPEEPNHVL